VSSRSVVFASISHADRQPVFAHGASAAAAISGSGWSTRCGPPLTWRGLTPWELHSAASLSQGTAVASWGWGTAAAVGSAGGTQGSDTISGFDCILSVGGGRVCGQLSCRPFEVLLGFGDSPVAAVLAAFEPSHFIVAVKLELPQKLCAFSSIQLLAQAPISILKDLCSAPLLNVRETVHISPHNRRASLSS